MSITEIAVIGGGIGGLSSAIFLSRMGYNVTIYDKAKKPQAVGAGFLLQPPGQAVLAELGILDEIINLSVPIQALKSETQSGYKLLDLHYGHLNGQARHGLGVQRNTIYNALYNLASGFKNIEFKWGCDVKTCTSEASTSESSKVSVYVDSEVYNYDLCILSAGSNSHLADNHFKGRVKKTYSWKCLWTTIKLPSGLSENTLHQRCHRADKMMGILPVTLAKSQYEAVLYWSLSDKDASRFSEQTFLSLKEEIIQFWPEARSAIEPLKFDDFIVANYNDIWTPKPFNKRVVAIGDISHSTSPQLGQGCTMALLDSWLLATHLNLNNDRELHKSLKTWWHMRKAQVIYVRQISKLLTPLYQSDRKLNGMFRNCVVAPMGRIPWIYHLQLKTLASDVFLKKKH